jgi:glycerol-3-phosphate dehydrogenase subunit B
VRHVIVVGAGVAGTAAALAAAEDGARVTLVAGGTGASVLAGGALDDVAWDEPGVRGAPLPLPWRARGVLEALGGYSVGEARALVATTTGLVRPARGVDRALLDLAPLARKTVLVVGAPHGGWDAAALARAWGASPRSDMASLSFVCAEASLVMHTEEQSFSDADLAARHDDPGRLAWLGARLRDVLERVGKEVSGIVLPPWLGLAQERASALTEVVGLPCGEALGGVGGPSGLRFEHARDRTLGAAGVTIVASRAIRVAHRPESEEEDAWRVVIDLPTAGGGHLDGHAVILATGGLLGGGLEYTPSGAYFGDVLPGTLRPLLRATCAAPVQLGAFGRALDDASSQFGAAPETHAWPYVETPLLDHAGVLVDEQGEVLGAPRGLYAAGELAAGPPHTWLAALIAGTRAGAAAVRG